MNGGTSVTLTASPLSGSNFRGWNGEGCTGNGTCTVRIELLGEESVHLLTEVN